VPSVDRSTRSNAHSKRQVLVEGAKARRCSEGEAQVLSDAALVLVAARPLGLVGDDPSRRVGLGQDGREASRFRGSADGLAIERRRSPTAKTGGRVRFSRRPVLCRGPSPRSQARSIRRSQPRSQATRRNRAGSRPRGQQARFFHPRLSILGFRGPFWFEPEARGATIPPSGCKLLWSWASAEGSAALRLVADFPRLPAVRRLLDRAVVQGDEEPLGL
jgi:hypothetical protein